MAKIAITIPQEALTRARGAIRRTRSSLSAYISKAVDEMVQADDLDALLEQMRRERGDGPMTSAEVRAADLALFGVGKKKQKRKTR